MNRRNILKSLTILPFAGGFLPQESNAAPATENQLAAAGTPAADPANIYESIGVDPVINCRGTFTIIGGSIERPEVLAAMKAASGYFVQYDELASGIGQRLAKLTGAEWGMVSAGCAAGLKHVTAACVTGGNPEKLIRIPDLTGFEKTEVIIPAHSRNVYDHALRNIGVSVLTVNTAEELQQAITSRTALIYIMTGNETETGKPLSLEVIAGIARPKNIPVIVDAAAENLTIPNIHLQRGATVVAYSGGKAICGPQCAGLLLGSKDLLMSAWQASAPHHGPGRDNKIGKEEMMGMLAAVEAWITRDHDAEWKLWLSRLDFIAQRVTKIEGVTSSVQEPTGINNRAPRLTLSWNPEKIYITGEEMAENFARNKPRVAIGGRTGRDGMTSISINPSQMQSGSEKVVADRIYNALTQKRSPRNTTMGPASVNIGGHWSVTVEYFTSKSEHALFIEQDGNWIQGTHKGDFSVQEVAGMVEGDQVKLVSNHRVPGDGVTFMFSGTVSGDTISGSIYLGEYLNARFMAKKSTYRSERRRVVIPGGPPLST